MNVYLDNAATTPMDPEVVALMTRVMTENYGNPSSIHALGRKSRTLIEKSRKKVAKHLGVAPGEIFFTSGGTEADNMAISCAVRDLGVTHIITSPLEHHAVLHSAERMVEEHGVKLSIVQLLPDGHVDLGHLKTLLEENADRKTLVSLMHANNEVGNLLDVAQVGALCRENGAYFHTDTVQTIGHLEVTPKEWGVHFLAASAHKFHGPKGIGFIYVDENVQVKPILTGGSQERNMRGGTENLIGIVGMAKALDIAIEELDEIRTRLTDIRNHMMTRLQNEIEGVKFNGDYNGRTNYIVLNVAFPDNGDGDMMLFNLDIAGIAASGGSACSSGSNVGSHVLRAIGKNLNMNSVRFSFGKFTTKEDVDYAVDKLVELINGKAVQA
ncbi:MAG: cysteine desulfurase [Bacteroidetes bacterium]|nr:cysteine desulfurase [Bacteroidota bacterium]